MTSHSSRTELARGLTVAAALIGVSLALTLAPPSLMTKDLKLRIIGIVMGMVVVLYANAIPKALTPLARMACDPATEQRLRRFTGWAFALGGIAYALCWMILPAAFALPLATGLLFTALVAVVGRIVLARRSTLALGLAVLACAATSANAQNRALGEWYGVLAAPSGRLTVVFRFQQSGDSVSGTLESIDQAPGQRIPLAKVAATTSVLTFAIPAIGGSYAGTWNDAEQQWTGTFTQGMALPLTLKKGAPPAPAIVQGVDGTWRGTLKRDTATLHLILHVGTKANGTSATLDSPDIGAFNLDVEGLTRVRDTLRFRVPIASVEFAGQVSDQTHTIRGQWSRAGQPAAAVTFERDAPATKPTSHVRTQWPLMPEGYRAEEVSFVNPTAPSVTLAGTLTIPAGRGPFPAAVLISGSGPQDRDEALFGHRPFAVLADYLSKRGIAVLRYDDRGFAKSTGDHSAATSVDFATDANAAVRFLLTRADIDHKAIGFVGHSEGGMIGPIAAVDNRDVAYLVLLAGPGTNTDQLLLSQRRLIGVSQGVPPAFLAKSEPVMRDVFHAVRIATDSGAAVAGVRAVLTDDRLEAMGAGSAQREMIVAQLTAPWMRYFLKYEPSAFLPRLRVPVLALNGSLDQQVPATENLAGMRALLAGNPAATVRELPGLNHLFQTATTGAVSEYEDIAETFAPSAMNVVAEWIRQVTLTRTTGR